MIVLRMNNLVFSFVAYMVRIYFHFFLTDSATIQIYWYVHTLSQHGALPIEQGKGGGPPVFRIPHRAAGRVDRRGGRHRAGGQPAPGARPFHRGGWRRGGTGKLCAADRDLRGRGPAGSAGRGPCGQRPVDRKSTRLNSSP